MPIHNEVKEALNRVGETHEMHSKYADQLNIWIDEAYFRIQTRQFPFIIQPLKFQMDRDAVTMKLPTDLDLEELTELEQALNEQVVDIPENETNLDFNALAAGARQKDKELLDAQREQSAKDSKRNQEREQLFKDLRKQISDLKFQNSSLARELAELKRSKQSNGSDDTDFFESLKTD